MNMLRWTKNYIFMAMKIRVCIYKKALQKRGLKRYKTSRIGTALGCHKQHKARPKFQTDYIFLSLPTQNTTWVGLSWTDLLLTPRQVILKKGKESLQETHPDQSRFLVYPPTRLHTQTEIPQHHEFAVSKHTAAHKSFQFLPTGFMHNLSSKVCKKIFTLLSSTRYHQLKKNSGLEFELQVWFRDLEVCLRDNYML